ncbi:glycosyltransferase family 2 protein [Streptomonospora nanhaiensis]|uniref:Glucosyl-3-phosphoglycerate synthase n=1 Tax=Streptomonospora nanhaiensis TaxID=1323731 RepID=A0A853BR68_9ACTN|nr:glycosyltransferase [Streptomonospora nanhaiensis]MBV2364302.1 glycosyltransferase [Streptomonospora nanhaiensis]MBX9391552.1 glycosyltransferase [Streptomonospora nanhaiensis]NYI97186.1 glycosyltransferase involved in cell wall biosynthesis [Streptomonospora nanhaiensis]
MTDNPGPGGAVAVIIPAKDEADRVGATVRASALLPGADLVVVVDDGSRDSTAAVAASAGARVLRHARNRGKGAAMETGAEGVRLIEQCAAPPARPPRHLLFLDADLGDTAAGAAPLVEPVRAGDADMTIALFPATRMRLGGHGFVVRLAREGIRRATGWEPEQPLSGQRCLTRAAFEAARPLAAGFGVETGLTVDVLRRGMRVVEVEVPLEHRPTGTDLRAQAHRARQFADVGRALAERELGPALERGARRLSAEARAAALAASRTFVRHGAGFPKRGEYRSRDTP